MILVAIYDDKYKLVFLGKYTYSAAINGFFVPRK